MKFWEQFALIQAQAALHVIIMKYAKSYFTLEEQQALVTISDALIELPGRIHGEVLTTAVVSSGVQKETVLPLQNLPSPLHKNVKK